MSEENLKYAAMQLAQNFASESEYSTWLDAGVRAIVLDGDTEDTAFRFAEYIIGTEVGGWKKDLSFIYRSLPAKHQTYFRAGLAKCLDTVNPELEANDPSRNGGKNPERLAITYLSIAREIKVPEVLGTLPTLFQTKFPRSQAIYDASLLTWRIMADSSSLVDWHDEFCPTDRQELRYRPSYSTLIAFGMCVARPHQANYFLHEWEPLEHYITQLGEETSPENIDKIRSILEAFSMISAYIRGQEMTRLYSPAKMVLDINSGKPRSFSESLSLAGNLARNRRRPLPTTAKDKHPLHIGIKAQADLAVPISP